MSPNKRTKPLAQIEVDEEDPQATLNLPLDWNGTLNLSKSVKSFRMLLDKYGNVIGFPVVLLNPATGGLYTLSADATSLTAIANAVWTSTTRRLTDADNIGADIGFQRTINAAGIYEFTSAAFSFPTNALYGGITIYCADVAVLIEVCDGAGNWFTLDTFAAKHIVNCFLSAPNAAGQVGNIRIRNPGVNNNVVYIYFGMAFILPP